MTDPGDASDVSSPSHETSASPPPAKRTRLYFKGKTPTPSISASPPASRIYTRRSVALTSSTSTSVAGDAHHLASLIIPEADPAPSTRDSRASSVVSGSGPHTRSRKRKADQLSSATPSVGGEPMTRASSFQDLNVNGEAALEFHDKVNTPDGLTKGDQDEDRTQDGGQEEKPDHAQQVTVSRRGRPPGKGKGGAKAGGRVAGKGKGKAKGGPSRQNSGIPETVKRPAGRGGRGKKTSANHEVQVAYDRQADLKLNFREVSRFLRAGFDMLADKSLDLVREDPTFYMKVPEFQIVRDELDAKRNAVISQQDRLYNMRLDHSRRRKEMDDEYSIIEFQCNIQDMKDKYEMRCKAAVLDTVWRSKPVVDSSASVVPEEQANFRVLSEERSDVADGEAAAGDIAEAGTGPVRRTKRSSPKKRGAKEAPSDEHVAKRPSLLSAAALPAEQPEDGQVPPDSVLESVQENQVLEPLSKDLDDDDQPLIYFPHIVRRGRQQEPNNRAVVKPHIHFDKDEIGFRNIYAEAEGQPPQLKSFHLDVLSFSAGTGNGYNLADHSVGDFDMNLVRRHRLHPQFGIPIPGCRNPDNVEPQTDFTKPVPRTTPITFITKDGKATHDTSRSATLLHNQEDWGKFEKLFDVKAAVGKFDPRELFTANGLATYDAVAREVDKCHIGAEELLLAALEIEQSHVQPPKRQKIIAGSTPAATGQILGNYDDIREIEREIFMRRPHAPQQGESGALDALADMAALVSRETGRRSPAPVQYAPQTSTQSSTSFRSNYSPPKRTYSQAFSQMQGPGQKTKYLPAPKHASPQMMAAATTRPLPKRREPPLPVESTAPTQMHLESTAPRPRAPQSMAAISFAPQPQPMAPPRGHQAVAPSGRGPQNMVPPMRAPQPMAPSARASYTAAPLAKSQQTGGPYTRAPQSVAPQPATHGSRSAQLMPQPISGHHVTAPQQAAPNRMAPPAVPNQSIGPQKMAPQLMSPRSMGPPPPAPPKMPSPNMGQPKGSSQAMGPPPNLPNPTQSTFTRPRNMTGGQTVLPVPTPSQMPSPQMHSPQHIPQAQPYFTGPQHQQHVQQPQQQPMQQTQHQQPQQLQQLAPTPSRPNRGSHSHSLPTLAPRPDGRSSHSRQGPRHHQHHYDNAATIPPFQGPIIAPSGERIYKYSTRDSYAPQQTQQQQVQQQQMQQQSQQQVQQQNHPQAQQQSFTQAQPQPYQQGYPQAPPQAPSHGPPPSQSQAQGQGQIRAQAQVQSSAQPQAPQAQQFQSQQQQGHPVAQAQQYLPQIQQRQPQSPAQQLQHPPQQRQAQSPAQQYQQTQPMQQQQTQQHQPQSPAQSFQQAPQHHQTHSPAQAFQRPAPQQPQSPVTQPQSLEQLQLLQHRKSFGGDGVEEREPYQSPVTQFRPINKQYPSHPQQQRYAQHRSPYQNPPQHPSQAPQPGQQVPSQQQPSFITLPPALPPPPPGRRGMGSYSGYPEQ